MKALKARVTKGFQKDSRIPVCDNSGAKEIKGVKAETHAVLLLILSQHPLLKAILK